MPAHKQRVSHQLTHTAILGLEFIGASKQLSTRGGGAPSDLSTERYFRFARVLA